MTTLKDVLHDFAQDVLAASQESADAAEWQEKVENLIEEYLGANHES
jgi:hypothetical protein